MKILWATNTPSLAEKKVNKELVRGGWIKSLQAQLKKMPDIELGIVFLGENEENFILDNCQYFSIKRKNSNKYKRLIARKLHRFEGELDLKKFKQVIDTFNPDIIHIHGTENEFGLIHSFTSIPIVFSIQGILSAIIYKYYSGIPKNIIHKYSSIKDRVLGLDLNTLAKQYEERIKIEKKVLSNAEYIIGRTDWDHRIIKILAPKAKYYHNDEILRSNFYKKTWHPIDTDIVKIFTTSGEANYKGIETIIDTAILLKKNKLRFEWKVAGITEKEKIAKICEKYRRIEFKNININLLGDLKEVDLIKEMLKANIFIQVSHIENSSNSLCEAMILGMPIIATNVGGTASLLRDKQDGILIQDGDPYALAGAIFESLDSQNDFIQYAKNARQRAYKRHNANKILKNLLNIYLHIINLKNV